MSGLSTETVSRLVQIVLVNLVLSGDNAVVIGLAAHPCHLRSETSPS